MASQEMEVEDIRGREGSDERGETQRALGALGFLTQEAEPSGTMLVDACTSFIELIRLAMLWNVQHRCPVGARFYFNCYRHRAQLLLRQPGESPVKIMSR